MAKNKQCTKCKKQKPFSAFNKSKLEKDRGVRLDRGRWRACVQHRGKQIHLGLFDTAIQAAQAYDAAAKQFHGDKAKLNFGRLITTKEEYIYRLCSPDFFGLSYSAAAKLMHMSKDGIYEAMKRIKQKCPILFPLILPIGKTLRYSPWMDIEIKQKF